MSTAALSLKDFSDASLSAAEDQGWTFTDITSSGATYTSDGTQGFIIHDSDWAVLDGNHNRWSGIIQVDAQSLLNVALSGSGILLQQTKPNIGGMGYSNGRETGALWGSAYPSLTLAVTTLAQCVDDGGNLTMGVITMGGNGTAIYIVDGQKQVYSASSSVLGLQSKADSANIGMSLTAASGVMYKQLYLFGDQVTGEDMTSMLQNLVVQAEENWFVWAGSGASAVWDTSTQNWTRGGDPVTYQSKIISKAVFGTAAPAKQVIVDTEIIAGRVEVQDAYTFVVSSTLSIESLATPGTGSATICGDGHITISSIGLGCNLIIGENTRVNTSDISVAEAVGTLASGAGTLVVEKFSVSGGSVTVASGLEIFGGGDGMGATNRSQGFNLTNADAMVNLLGNTYITGALYIALGTVNIGDGTDAVRVETNRVEFGDTGGTGTSTLNINKNAILHVKAGDMANAYASTGLLMGEWAGLSVANVYGKLYADQATAYVGDSMVTFNIEEGGLMAVKGLSQNQFKDAKTETINLNLNDGGTLVLGENGITGQKPVNINFAAGEVGISDYYVEIAKDVTLSGFGTSFNTNVYEWQGYDDTLELAPGEAGGTLTISGNITGEGSIVKEGEGSLVLSGNNNILTHTIQLREGRLELAGTFNVSGLVNEDSRGSFIDGENAGNGFLDAPDRVAHVVEITDGASLECCGIFTIDGTYAEFNSTTGDAKVDAETYYTTFYINEAHTQESLAHAIDASANQIEEVRLKNATTLNVDSNGAILAQLTLAENADAELNVTADATIGKISDMPSGHTLAIRGDNESALTIGMPGEKSFSGSGDLVVEEGANVILRGNNSDYYGIVDIKGALAVGNATALGDGIVQVRGGRLDLDSLTIANRVTATGKSTIGNGTLTGVLIVDSATLTIDEDLTLGGNLIVENENRIEVADGATLHLTHTITIENYIELAGKIDISAITGTATGSSYVGGETKGNGFLQTGYEMMLIDCGLSGDFDWHEAEIYHSGNEVTKEDWGGVAYSVKDASNFYIFRGTESVSTAHSLEANARISLSSGTTLNVDESVNLSHILATGAASINVEDGKELSGYFSGYTLTLSGTGVYELASRSSLGSLVLGNDWSGTVRLKGSANDVNFNSMARTDSWLELKGFSGYPTTYNGTTSANIILTDKDDGTAAFTATYGYSYDNGYIMKYTGAIQGEGTFVANAGSNRYENYEFAGDIQDWSGKFRYASGRNTKLTISGNAHVVNAAIDGAGGLTLCVNTNATFNEAASVYGLTLNGSSATFNDSIQVSGSVSTSGISSLTISDGQVLSLGSAISNSGNLTLIGTFNVSGRTSVLIGSEYSGGVIAGNGFGNTLYGVQVVQNRGSATLNWSGAEVIYNTPGYEKRGDGSIVKGFNDGMFHVRTGTECVSTAQDAAEKAGITMQGVELKNGTTLTVDCDFSTSSISVISGTSYVNVEAGSSLQSDGGVRADLRLKGDGSFKLAAGSTEKEISWDDADWGGTVMLTDVTTTDLNLNTFGHEGSKVGLDRVSGNLARPNVCGEIMPTLVLTGDGLTVTACYTKSTYTFAGGVEGDGNWTYGLTGKPSDQTYIFTGDVSKWMGAYESIADGKTSTLQFCGVAVEMGAAIKATAGTVNVVVGNGTDAFATTFGNDITASSLKVQDKAVATLTKDTSIVGEIEVAGSLKIQGEGQLNVGDAVRMGAVEEGTPATLAGVDISSAELSARGVDKAELSGVSITTMDDFKLENVRLDGSFIDIGEDTTFYIKDVEISADTRITDGAARMFIEGGKAFLDESNTEAAAPTMSLADVTFFRSGDTETWMTLRENVSLVSLTSEVFTKVMLTGTDLWLDLTGLSAQVGDATAFSVSFEEGALFDVDSLRVYATLNGEKYLDGYTTQQSGGATTLYFSSQIPEPTTSTLSLLALAALVARRRRSR